MEHKGTRMPVEWWRATGKPAPGAPQAGEPERRPADGRHQQRHGIKLPKEAKGGWHEAGR